MHNPNQHSSKSEQLQDRFDPNKFARAIGSSEAFYKARVDYASVFGNDEEALENERPYTVAAAASELALQHEQASGRKTLEGYTYEVIAQIPGFVESTVALDELSRQDRHVSRKERLPFIRELSAFNSSLKELIDNNSKLEFDQTNRFLNSIANGMYEGRYQHLFKEEFSKTLNAMRHEIAAEQMLGVLEVDYEEAGTEDDLKGVDYFVSLDGRTSFGIDIKASKSNEFANRKKAEKYGIPVHRIIWSGVYEADFHNSFRISNELAKKQAPRMLTKLQAAEREATRAKRAA